MGLWGVGLKLILVILCFQQTVEGKVIAQKVGHNDFFPRLSPFSPDVRNHLKTMPLNSPKGFEYSDWVWTFSSQVLFLLHFKISTLKFGEFSTMLTASSTRASRRHMGRSRQRDRLGQKAICCQQVWTSEPALLVQVVNKLLFFSLQVSSHVHQIPAEMEHCARLRPLETPFASECCPSFSLHVPRIRFYSVMVSWTVLGFPVLISGSEAFLQFGRWCESARIEIVRCSWAAVLHEPSPPPHG